MRYAVRCDRHPDILLGWVEAPDKLIQGQTYRFELKHPQGAWPFPSTVLLTLGVYADTARSAALDPPLHPLEGWDRITERAFGSDGQPIETLRLIPSFVENEARGLLR